MRCWLMAGNDQISPWWSKARHADVRPFLMARSAVTRAIRAWFDEQGFAEVETAILQVSPGNETHLHAPRTELAGAGGERATRYLRTSPEFACKKLLAAGEAKIFELARVFRDRERGDLHLPEFDLLATIDGGEGDRAALAAAATEQVRITDDDTWSDIFSKVLVEHVEPNLGQGRLTVLFEYTAPEAALARAKASDPRVAERFEIYACGVELANGFGELTDAREQRHRFTLAMNEKQRRYGERYPLDEDFLDAVAKMPEASGVALGFDRLVMLASGALRIDQVVWTPPAGDA